MSSDAAKTPSLRSQSIWLLAAKLVAFACSFALPLVIVRALTKDQVGQYREAFQVITNAVIVLPLGFSMSAYYYLSRAAERRPAAICNIILFNLIVGAAAAAAFWIYPSMVADLFKAPDLIGVGPLMGVAIWASIFGSFLETVAIANSESRLATGFIVFSALSKTLLMGAAVIIFASVPAFVYAAIIQALLQTSVLLWYLNSRFAGWWRAFDRSFFIEHARYAIPFGLTGVLWIAQTDIHNYFVMARFASADVAIYTYGCFQLPLIAMLSESVSSVMIPRMNALQQDGDREEMIRITARAMQKLAFVYFPVYAFLMVTAGTFVTTLFTQEYARSVPIFMINLTLVPIGIVITDPIVRSFKELGRLFLLTRIAVLAGLVGVLYLAAGRIGLIGYISVAVGAIVFEKAVGESMVVRKLGLGLRHLGLLKNVAKTAVASGAAAIVTFVVYASVRSGLSAAAVQAVGDLMPPTGANAANFIAGGAVLAVAGLVFVATYLAVAASFGLIEDEEKEFVLRRLRRRTGAAIAENQA